MPSKMNKLTWREKRVVLEPNTPYKLSFLDTKPNYLYITNNGASAVTISSSANVSAVTFDMSVNGFASKLYAKMEGMKQVFLFTESAEPISVLVSSFEGEFDPTSLSQTQEIVSTSASGMLGTVNVSSIINPLPSGTNTIGQVIVSDFAKELPAGTQLIGKVGIDTMPDVTVNSMPSVDINSLPSVTLANKPKDPEKTSVGSSSVYGAVSVDVTATAIRVGASDLVNRHEVEIYNNTANDIFIGYDANVTVDNGFPVLAGEKKSIKLDPTDPVTVYGISSVASSIRVVENA